MSLLFANSAAEARGQAPPDNRVISEGNIYVSDPAVPLPSLNPIPAGGYDAYPAPAFPRVPAVFPQAWTLRPWDTALGQPELDGNHGVITRIQGTPVGALTPTGGAFRAVFRPLPSAWDAGYQLPYGPDVLGAPQPAPGS